MIEPLVVEFEVQAPAAHAFRVWTERCGLWWPSSHTVGRGPAAIVFEPHPDGRIYERGPDGAEHEWGRVLDWQPPQRLRYRWHLFFPPAEATEVEVTFTPRPDGTAVRIEQRGWDRLGGAGPARRTRTGQAWAAITQLFAVACQPAEKGPF
jgi:uncharacterized protein YndB with AHSA1/START domain